MTSPRWLVISRHILHSQRTRLAAWLRYSRTEHGATHAGWPISRSVAYVQRVFAEYLSYGQLSADWIAGKRVLEIGPGDNLGVALQFLASGAEQVVCIDRFRPNSDPVQQRSIYQALRDTLDSGEQTRYDAALDNPARLQVHYNLDVADGGILFQPGSFDLIVSRAVVTEFADPDRTFRVLDGLLRPGGRSIHKAAPLNDYGIFRGYHPLEFLTVPESVYGLMARGSGKPNRRLLSYYRQLFQNLGYEFHVAIAGLLGSSELLPPKTVTLLQSTPGYAQARSLVEQIRPRLQPYFRCAPEEDLVVADAFLLARKML